MPSTYKRQDGRKSGEARTLSAGFATLPRTDGSSSFAFGPTSAVAGAHGPIESRLSQEHPDRATLEVTYLPAAGIADTRSRVVEGSIRGALESLCLLGQYPRTLIQVAIQGVATEGAELATAANAATLALMDAGIPMKTLFLTTSCAVMEGFDQAGHLILDPSSEEAKEATSVHTVGFDGSGQVVLLSSVGDFTQEQLLEAIEVCRGGITQVQEYIRTRVSDRMRDLYPVLRDEGNVKA
ncbi:ribosomal protein S5 domain 2-type protein [Piptocephalis cylindrospora]|uniref:Ribosomal protein S5 domain 2-type protein n=1 Tax=Piptocephalis cylindrospora TaxID=1907219 RepID=A0A4P9Y8G9_9FUNG|nr:ribosomal protein S5 domain 2-type protein [Piptocephalis cylindrospora]|eukprot:RKP15373.1 ribosomal protein S5 domain 2-type protein [Piptocephalis cylindrospora]